VAASLDRPITEAFDHKIIAIILETELDTTIAKSVAANGPAGGSLVNCTAAQGPCWGKRVFTVGG